jgi:hypothetical protein
MVVYEALTRIAPEQLIAAGTLGIVREPDR